MAAETVVTVKDLKLALPAGGDRPRAVDGVSFDLTAGKILCVVGESGSGKSMCAHALMGLLPNNITAEAGEIMFDGRNLLTLDADAWLALRGRRIAMVFQEPMTALNPLMRIGDQIAEMFEAHDLLSPRDRKQKAIALLREVGLPDPEAHGAGLSASIVRRATPARDDRHGACARTGCAGGRRADHGPRRHHTGANPETDPRPAASRNMAVMLITHDFGVVAEHRRSGGRASSTAGSSNKARRATCWDIRNILTRALLAAVPAMQPPARSSSPIATRRSRSWAWTKPMSAAAAGSSLLAACRQPRT